MELGKWFNIFNLSDPCMILFTYVWLIFYSSCRKIQIPYKTTWILWAICLGLKLPPMMICLWGKFQFLPLDSPRFGEHIWILFQRHHGPSKSILNDILQFGQWLWRNSTTPTLCRFPWSLWTFYAFPAASILENSHIYPNLISRWRFQICFSFTPTWGNYPTWRACFFHWVETSNPLNKAYIHYNQPRLRRAAFESVIFNRD